MTDKKLISVLLVGVGGYGKKIANDVFDNCEKFGLTVAGIVDTNYENAEIKAIADEMKIPNYSSMEEFYKNHSADLAVISTPIHLHEKHCITAMQNGSDCFCEKPTAATLEQCENISKVALETGKKVNIGFQFCYMPSILNLKKDILANKFGKLLSTTAMICWPRNRAYFERPWAGKIKMGDNYVLDSIAMNACAHYLCLMLFLAGKEMNKSINLQSIEALLYRANKIETFDTAMLSAKADGISINYMATHTSKIEVPPTIKLVFENAVVEISEKDMKNGIKATFADGTVENYGEIDPFSSEKISYSADVARRLKEPICSPETTYPHILCVNSVTELVPVQEMTDVIEENETLIIPDIEDVFKKAYESNKMPWEVADMSGTPKMIDVTNYKGYGMNK